MKKLYLTLYLILYTSYITFSQTILSNCGTDITAEAGAIIYVGGEIVNETNGHIHNKGDIYLTHDWTNKEPTGGLDPTTGTVWLYGNAQTIKGTQSTTFNNLNCENGATKTLNIDTYVGGTSGVLQLKASPFILNTNTLYMTNPSGGGITRTTGYIRSETDPAAGYGIVQWSLNISTGNYVYPFGTAGGNYIPFIYNVTTAGAVSGIGSIAVSTYPTSVTANPNNRPLPTTVTDLTDPSTLTEAAPVCIDRFWPVTAYNYSTQPIGNLTFTYVESEWDNTGGSTNTIDEDSLRAWKWVVNQWQLPSLGTCNTAANTVYVPNVSAVSAPWTLLGDEPVPPPPPPPCGDFFLPNAFSPDGNGKNEYFKPRSTCIKTLDFRIYNRWGNLMYASTSPGDTGWDGTTPDTKEINEGVYAYQLKATMNDGKVIEQKGTVTLLK